mmetsp:Transcript_34146/g.69811  ORF Transcript_34146/g.69811 Transcript_34146/m.69811 type:complete len:82 (+) Transcript_34146:33-278(+)
MLNPGDMLRAKGRPALRSTSCGVTSNNKQPALHLQPGWGLLLTCPAYCLLPSWQPVSLKGSVEKPSPEKKAQRKQGKYVNK